MHIYDAGELFVVCNQVYFDVDVNVSWRQTSIDTAHMIPTMHPLTFVQTDSVDFVK